MTEITNRDIEATKELGEKLIENLDRFKETKFPFHTYFEYIKSKNRPGDDTCSKELYMKFIDVISIGDPIPVAEVIININEAKKMRKTRNIEEMEQKLEALQTTMADPSFYDKPFAETEPLLKEVAEVQASLDAATERWMELEEMTG